MRFVTKYTYDPFDHLQAFDPVGQTIPDQSMSLRTIIDRYSRGLPVNGSVNTPQYSGEDVDGVQPMLLDLAERQEYYSHKEAELVQLKASLQEAKRKTDEKLAERKRSEREALLEEVKASMRAGSQEQGPQN